MELSELLNSLIESGSEKIFHHYTDIIGFIGILRSKEIRPGNTFSNIIHDKKQISVIRPSGSKEIESIAGKESTKSIVALFEIQFHILNDKIRRVKSHPINEPAISFEKDIESILTKYHLLNKKKSVINNIEKYKDLFSTIDYKKLHNKIYNYQLNLINKEGEERLVVEESIPLDKSYVRIILKNNILNAYDKLSIKQKGMFDSLFFDYYDWFMENETYDVIYNRLMK